VTSLAESSAHSRARKAQGERTRQAILESAIHIASEEGLEGLTIGRLASEMKMSKSGLFAHFGSKEELQLATVEAAREVFIENVVSPAFEAERGLARLWKLCEVWFNYASQHVFRGGCFFFAASAEFDGRPGPVRDRIAEIMREWLKLLERTVREAQDADQLEQNIDPVQLAFEINALELGANWAFQLYGDEKVFLKARDSILQRLHHLSSNTSSLSLPPRQKRRRPAKKS
jgi:AcrR family transcriptional regulator